VEAMSPFVILLILNFLRRIWITSSGLGNTQVFFFGLVLIFDAAIFSYLFNCWTRNHPPNAFWGKLTWARLQESKWKVRTSGWLWYRMQPEKILGCFDISPFVGLSYMIWWVRGRSYYIWHLVGRTAIEKEWKRTMINLLFVLMAHGNLPPFVLMAHGNLLQLPLMAHGNLLQLPL